MSGAEREAAAQAPAPVPGRARWFVPGKDNLAARADLSPYKLAALTWLGICDEARRDAGGRGHLEALMIGGEIVVATAEVDGRPAMEIYRVAELAALVHEAGALC